MNINIRYSVNGQSKCVDLDMDDEMFLGVINYNASYVSEIDKLAGYKVELSTYVTDGTQKPKRYVVTNPDTVDILTEMGERIQEELQ